MRGQEFHLKMKDKLLILLLVFHTLMVTSENYGIVVHGGAGVLSNLTEAQQKNIEQKLTKTLIASYQILENGGSSLDLSLIHI